MKVGYKLTAIDECIMTVSKEAALTIGREYKVKNVYETDFTIIDNQGDSHFFDYADYEVYFNKPQLDSHYDNSNGSLYKFAVDHDLNAFEFDCIKRLVRCRKKGQFREDLEKTIRVIELYLKEMEL